MVWSWTRPIGILLSLIMFVGLLLLGFRADPTRDVPAADLRNGRVFIQDNLWSTRTRQYAVWVAPDGAPYAGWRRLPDGHWNVESLASLSGNPLATPTSDNEHAVYVIGVDAAEGIHIAGNMAVSPLRYVHGTPDLDEWSPGPPPRAGNMVTYPAFTALPDGTLLFWHQQGVVSEQGAIVLNVLEPGARSWRSLGPILSGRGSGETPYLNHIGVDARSGVIHLAYQWRHGAGVETTNDLGYARSSDGGRTWETSDGRRLTTPISHTSSETIVDTPDRGSGLINQGGLTVDAWGRPHVVVVFDRYERGKAWLHLWLDGDAWRREWITDLDLEGRPQLAGTPDGRVWLLGARGTAIQAIDVTPGRERAPSREVGRVPLGWEVSYDSQALAREGVVRMLVPEGDEPRVLDADLSVP
jgi:hypothetical protein